MMPDAFYLSYQEAIEILNNIYKLQPQEIVILALASKTSPHEIPNSYSQIFSQFNFIDEETRKEETQAVRSDVAYIANLVVDLKKSSWGVNSYSYTLLNEKQLHKTLEDNNVLVCDSIM